MTFAISIHSFFVIIPKFTFILVIIIWSRTIQSFSSPMKWKIAKSSIWFFKWMKIPIISFTIFSRLIWILVLSQNSYSNYSSFEIPYFYFLSNKSQIEKTRLSPWATRLSRLSFKITTLSTYPPRYQAKSHKATPALLRPFLVNIWWGEG